MAWIEGFGWFAAVLAVSLIVASGLFQKLAHWFWDVVLDPAPLRALGVLGVAKKRKERPAVLRGAPLLLWY